MNVFLVLFLKLIPLYAVIFLGYLARKYLSVKKDAISDLLIYILVPIVVFNGVSTIEINPGTLSIPVLFLIIPSFIAVISYWFLGFIWKDRTRNMLALAAGSANIGYFGLPVINSLLGKNAVGVVALSIVGISLYHNTFGLFIAAKGNHTTKESLLKIIKLPIVYAFLIGLILNLSGIRLNETLTDTLAAFNGTFTVLGMMLIGVALGGCKKFYFDAKFIAITMFTSFILWPAVMLGVIFLDKTYLLLYDPKLYGVFMILSVVPLGANLVAYATFLDNNPEKISLSVLISTVVALFYIPFVASFFV